MSDLLFHVDAQTDRIVIEERTRANNKVETFTICELTHDEGGKLYAWLGYALNRPRGAIDRVHLAEDV